MADKEKTEKEDKKGKTNGKEGAQAPVNMPLFYKQPMPLDAKKHAKLGLKVNFGFGFTKEVNAVPINLIEMPYPISFVSTLHSSICPCVSPRSKVLSSISWIGLIVILVFIQFFNSSSSMSSFTRV